jgi:predicted esterase
MDDGESALATSHVMQSNPVFMGHGIDDKKLPKEFGRVATGFLDNMDVDVTCKEYEGLRHWIFEDLSRDIVRFLQDLNGWSAE